jgi:hypothetical protein
VERVKSEDFIDWVHRRLDEGDSNSDLRPSKPFDSLTPSDPYGCFHVYCQSREFKLVELVPV